MLAPRPTDDGGGPAGVVERPPKRLLGAGVVEPAADVLGVLAGVPKLNVGGVDELFPSGFDWPKEKAFPPSVLCPPNTPPPAALLLDPPPPKSDGPVPVFPVLPPKRLPPDGVLFAPADPNRPPEAAPDEDGVPPKLKAMVLKVSRSG